MRSADEHYPQEEVGGALGLPGAGILAWLTADQLHPPMLLDQHMWRHGAEWRQGACRYVAQLGSLAELQPGDQVLDIGCGLCGPARLLVDIFDVFVTAITNSKTHVATSNILNSRSAKHRTNIRVQHVRGLNDWPVRHFDLAWSLNMLYQVPCHRNIFKRVNDVLSPGGRFVIDDWVATDLITENDLLLFEHHFQYRELLRISRVESDLVASGFYPAIRIVDRGAVGRGPMRRHFCTVMEEFFLPRLEARWPRASGSQIDGRQMGQHFIEAVNYTIHLYEEGKLTYRTMVAVKR